MANTKSYSIGPSLSTAEQVAGFCYLPCYLFLLSYAISYCANLLGITLDAVSLNGCYFALNTIFIWIIFHKFLLKSVGAIRFWELVQAIILGFVMYYAGTRILNYVLAFLQLNISHFNDETVAQLVSHNRIVTLVCTIAIAPLVEETLVRGLVFGSVRRKNRILAYVISILLFSFMHVWQYLSRHDLSAVVLAAIPYIPPSIALAWTYEKANTIWAPILLHMIINSIGMSLLG